MDLKEIKHQIRLFFQGKETSKNRRIIDTWYHFHDRGLPELDELDGREKELLRQQMLQEIRKQAGISVKKLHKVGAVPSLRKKTWHYKLAAGFAVLLLASLPVLLMNIYEPEISSIEYQTSYNPPGQSSQITLSDGTTVWLSANSTLEYPEQFEENHREVILNGEAFFDVVQHTDKPFIVHSGYLQTRVLGTSFNIRAFETEEDIEITVVTGRVSIDQIRAPADSEYGGGDESVAMLDPNQRFVYNNSIRKGITHTVDSRLYTSWKDGQLIFENHTFEEIARRLEHWYGVDIHFANSELKQARFRITFENSSLQHALRMLQVIRDFEFEIEEQQIWIK